MSPEFLRPCEYKFYEEQPRPKAGWPDRDSLPALRKSLDKAHDNLRLMVRENNQLRDAQLTTNRRQKLQLQIFLWLVGITWSALGWALHLLIPYAVRGMAR